MGEMTDKAKGLANEAAGNVKQAVGKATDNQKLQAEGIAQERKGEAQQVAGKVKGALGDKV
ncbi:MAG: CsbD family protein [Novosphingobium sp. 16-62-11]|uniref:CsbD family protein n=1 Tax=Novosphingobium sp. 17-62-19 TaxID=1970406 RepID=UPI000BC978AB|nr:CsbD family protein [Novosphingobium sp. 17-62-19]OYX92859.1 MAG: CsbD family protein [Novosphingobium sp. 35-62-5]OYZ32644.1 MAG: CsbD family protein [Novosphingobium sp. 16-62-11]OZA18674.1 MAG: CsbD family protein [Novosphingobium sp. 17-62-19]HQS97050.1 CsbD family protein [Novosphingobium sp.]